MQQATQQIANFNQQFAKNTDRWNNYEIFKNQAEKHFHFVTNIEKVLNSNKDELSTRLTKFQQDVSQQNEKIRAFQRDLDEKIRQVRYIEQMMDDSTTKY